MFSSCEILTTGMDQAGFLLEIFEKASLTIKQKSCSLFEVKKYETNASSWRTSRCVKPLSNVKNHTVLYRISVQALQALTWNPDKYRTFSIGEMWRENLLTIIINFTCSGNTVVDLINSQTLIESQRTWGEEQIVIMYLGNVSCSDTKIFNELLALHLTNAHGRLIVVLHVWRQVKFCENTETD